MFSPSQVIATLEIGSVFGGGATAMGSGELQNSLRVLTTTSLTAYHCHVEVFLKYASNHLVR